MIVRMSKVEIIGPRQHLHGVLDLVRDRGDLHIDPGTVSFYSEEDSTAEVHGLLSDEATLFEKVFLDKLRDKIKKLFACLPRLHLRESYLSPRPIIDSIDQGLEAHLEYCIDLNSRRRDLEKRLAELTRHEQFLESISPLLEDLRQTPDVDYIGINIRDRQGVEILRAHLDCLADGTCAVLTVDRKEGGVAGLIAVARERSAEVSRVLQEEQLPEYTFPGLAQDLPFVQQADYLRSETDRCEKELAVVTEQQLEFTRRWGPIYKKTVEWIDNRLSILQASAQAFETTLCFVVWGWMPSDKVDGLRTALQQKWAGEVMLEEKAIRAEDMERIPVVLKNPAYFKPFENLTRLLPLPAYTSFDPTPFLGVFFPVFFGLILGDAGYGVILFVVSAVLATRSTLPRLVQDFAKIFTICSLYTIVFGLLYGEVLGDLGHRYLHLKPLLFDRQSNIMPMLFFALSVGLVHVLLGLFLGLVGAIRKKTRREAMLKLFNLLLILMFAALLVSSIGYLPQLMTRPLIIVILILTPILFFTGGLLAPLELLKYLGNIVSYARIMAIGLTSVLLAVVANRLAGLTGDIVLGALVGGLIHLLGIVIGLFSSSIHALRLHYVEFFDKFLSYGGRRYDPLRDEKDRPRDRGERREQVRRPEKKEHRGEAPTPAGDLTAHTKK